MVIKKWFAFFGGLGLAALAAVLIWQKYTSSALPTLRILAYDSFSGLSGPGPKLVKEFQRRCGCDVKIWSGGDAGLLLEQLHLREHGSAVDLVIGLDQLILDKAQRSWSWRTLDGVDVPWVAGVSPRGPFIPFDWAPMAFIYRKSELDPPQDWRALLEPRFRQAISLPDARSSTVGHQFLFAIAKTQGRDQVREFLSALKPNLLAVPASWSESYGLFQRGQVKLTFSYLTSLVFHRTVEKTDDFQVAPMASGHPRQIEYLGVSQGCQQCDLAREFIELMLSSEGQAIVMNSNFMFPARRDVVRGTPFADLPDLKVFAEEESEGERADASLLQFWSEVFQ